jgi:EAL domain-containing protein (putative c-di-GMP-specific phosphodiesterase class I)
MSLFTSQQFEQAFERKELLHYFQPIVSLETGKVLSFEALVRWQHPTLGLLSSGQFIVDLVGCGFANKLTRLGLRRVIQFHQIAAIKGKRPLPMSINIAACEFEQLKGIEEIDALLQKYAIPKQMIYFEMLEWHETIDLNKVSETVSALKTIGVDVVADDFGHAYGSFHHMMNMPFSGIKLDREYPQALNAKREAQAIVQAMVSFTKHLGISLVVEGVETKYEADMLQFLGVKAVQGHYYYPALSYIDALALLPDLA